MLSRGSSSSQKIPPRKNPVIGVIVEAVVLSVWMAISVVDEIGLKIVVLVYVFFVVVSPSDTGGKAPADQYLPPGARAPAGHHRVVAENGLKEGNRQDRCGPLGCVVWRCG